MRQLPGALQQLSIKCNELFVLEPGMGVRCSLNHVCVYERHTVFHIDFFNLQGN
jgi:hypothetical protein